MCDSVVRYKMWIPYQRSVTLGDNFETQIEAGRASRNNRRLIFSDERKGVRIVDFEGATKSVRRFGIKLG